VMDYREGFHGGSFPSLDTIRTGCEHLWDSIHLAASGPVSVAMVALGSGTGSLGLVDSVRIACETLKAHHAILKDSRVQKVVFYGYQLHEYVAMRGEVARHFALSSAAP
jgi:O-acetyl-ADP-ribose deacetylase